MATIRDVARRAGVSAASVSRVLKNDTTFSVSQKTRERILEAAGELGYNKCFEYSAIQGTRGTIGVMLLYGEEEEVEDKFYQIIRVNIKMELEKNGFKVKEVYAGCQRIEDIRLSGFDLCRIFHTLVSKEGVQTGCSGFRIAGGMCGLSPERRIAYS